MPGVFKKLNASDIKITPFEMGLINGGQPKSIIESSPIFKALIRPYSNGPRNKVKEGLVFESNTKDEL